MASKSLTKYTLTWKEGEKELGWKNDFNAKTELCFSVLQPQWHTQGRQGVSVFYALGVGTPVVVANNTVLFLSPALLKEDVESQYWVYAIFLKFLLLLLGPHVSNFVAVVTAVGFQRTLTSGMLSPCRLLVDLASLFVIYEVTTGPRRLCGLSAQTHWKQNKGNYSKSVLKSTLFTVWLSQVIILSTWWWTKK